MRDEFSITERLRRQVALPAGSRVVLGIGDDCAIYRPGGAEDLIFTTDMLIEGVHFTTATHTAAQIGRKALARSLSDIAAMGGEPRFCLVSLALPADTSETSWTRPFFSGLRKLASATGTVLAGGDLSHSPEIMCDVMVAGAVPRGKALRRDGAEPGHHIYVSGRLGGSALGLATQQGPGWRRHLNPTPRLALGTFLREQLHATAAMDLSDGLSLDLRRLALASGVAAEIVEPPRFPGATLEQSLHGGEDYELLFTVRASAPVPKRFGRVPLTRIGTIIPSSPRRRRGEIYLDGRLISTEGYDHFARSG